MRQSRERDAFLEKKEIDSERERERERERRERLRLRLGDRKRKRRKPKPACPHGKGEIGSGQNLCLNGTDYCLSSSCHVTGKANIILIFSSFSYHKKVGN